MKRAVILSLIMVWGLATLGGAQALADQNSSAGLLLVEAVWLLEKARAEPDLELRVTLITLVEEKLLQIIDSYPGSDAAVKLAMEQGIGTLSLERLASEKMKYQVLAITARAATQAAAQAELGAEACFATPSRECLWEQALAVARKTEDVFDGDWILTDLVAAQIAAGYLGEASFTANEIVGAKKRLRAYGDLAVAEAEAGDVTGAMRTAWKVSAANGRAWILSKIAAARVNAGNRGLGETQALTSGALADADELRDFDERAEVLAEIAKIQAMAGELEQARHTFGKALAIAKRIRDDRDRVEVLANIATAQAESGDVKQARKTIAKALAKAKKIISRIYRSSSLAEIAIAQAKVTGVEEALATAREIGESYYRGQALADIALAEAQAGHVKKALATAKEIGDTERRGRALMYIAIAQAKAGDAKGGLVTAKEIGSANFRRWALVWVAEIQSEEGKSSQARQTIAEALAVAGETMNAFEHARILAVVAKIKIEAGDVQGARQAVSEALAATNETDDDYFRVRNLLRIASYLSD